MNNPTTTMGPRSIKDRAPKMAIKIARILSTFALIVVVFATIVSITTNGIEASRPSAVKPRATNASQEVGNGPKKCPPERDVEMDKCASSLGFLGDRTFVMPNNVSQMSDFCATLTRSLKCIQNYARECLNSFPRQVLLTVTRNGRKQYNTLCQTEQHKAVFIERLKCLNADNLEQLHQCMDGSIARFEYVDSNRVETNDKISAICCSYQIFKRDIHDTVERTCKMHDNVDKSKHSETVSQTAEYLHEIISTTTGELIDLVCGTYKTFEDCKAKPKMANLVETFTEITTRVKKRQVKPKAKSLISLFVNILNSF